jgi:ABC-2 type transport system permease protein
MRLWHVIWLDLKYHVRRPLFLILLFMLALTAYGLTGGEVSISAGDSAVGGDKAWLTSEYSNAFVFSILTILYFGFFVSVGAGLAIPNDEEYRVGEVLHATPLTTKEYIWGKFLAVLIAFMGILALQTILTMFFLHGLPNESAAKVIGPFHLINYLRPAFLFAAPLIVFVAGVTFMIGELTRRPILVFFFPVALIMIMLFFLWEWSPSWLDPRINSALAWLDPSGYRWMKETQLKVDRGVAFYNLQPIAYEMGFVFSRFAFFAIGFGAVAFAERHFRLTLRGEKALPKGAKTVVQANAPTWKSHSETSPLSTLSMTQSTPSWFAQMRNVAKFEFGGLITSPGMYLFVPLILLQALSDAYYQSGLYGSYLIVSAGSFASSTMNVLVLCIGLLLMFYTTESMMRERATGFWPLAHATPMHASAWLTGKALANTFVAFVILVTAFVGFLVLLAIQGGGHFSLLPFLVIWGGIMAPTFLAWSAWIILLNSITGSKFMTYALGLATLLATGWLNNKGVMNWVYNWQLLGAGRWSDLGLLEPNFTAVILNRILWVSISVLFIAITVRIYERREFDATRVVHRIYPKQLLRIGKGLLPYASVPVVLAIYIAFQIANGPEGKRAENIDHDYWKQNLATWKDAPKPTIRHVDADLKLDPPDHSFALKGTYKLANIEDEPMRKFAITLGSHIKEATWTMNGEKYEPENRTNLFVFTPKEPLAKDDEITIGFEYAAELPGGMTKNTGGAGEFIQPSGAVIQGWSPSLFPVVGWQEGIGVKGDENSYEAKVYPDDLYKEVVGAAYGSALPFTTRIRIDVPEEYRANSNGELIEETKADGRNVFVWQTDHPIMMFNVVVGKWEVRRGEGTAIFYNALHDENLDEMIEALDGARKYYSEWFYPYPWKELKLSEFANLASYAQGFATNITFSESIGFRARSDEKAQAAFTITAHESAHQWWGNTLVPGEGPGGNILSEGMSHFSTILLIEQLKGEAARIQFCKRIEETYGESRVVDSERPMNRTLGDKAGETTVVYDKGGFVFYMLHRLMGREANLAGCQAFIRNHETNPDHPLLEDFVDEMRPFAPDVEAYDAFVKQWIFSTDVPMYEFKDMTREKTGDAWIVKGTVTNKGKGKMEVEVAATSVEDRFEKQTKESLKAGPAKVAQDYADARTRVTLGEGESAEVQIECAFEPKFVVMDPDVTQLMINRKLAVHRF